MEHANDIKEDDKENVDDYPISGDPSMYVTLPVQNDEIWKRYQTTLDWFWTAHDVYLENDKRDMTKTFSEEQCQYILKISSFMFTSHCTIVNKELFMQLMNDVGIKEASYYFGSQADTKKTHSMVYSFLLDELVKDGPVTKDKLIKDVVQIPMVRDFIKWSIHSTNSNTTMSFSKRLLAFTSIQGIIFPGIFVLFSWIRNQHPQMMPGLARSNDLIWRDERLNLSFSCMLFKYIDEKLDETDAQTIVGQATALAKNLLINIFPVSTLGLDCNVVANYIEHSADKVLSNLGFSKLYGANCQLDWLEEPEIALEESRNPDLMSVDLSYRSEKQEFKTDSNLF